MQENTKFLLNSEYDIKPCVEANFSTRLYFRLLGSAFVCIGNEFYADKQYLPYELYSVKKDVIEPKLTFAVSVYVI